MGHSKAWKVALLVILVAMMLGVGHVEQRKRQTPMVESSATDDVKAERDQANVDEQLHDTVSQFLTDLVGDASELGTNAAVSTTQPFPLIAELPPLPRAFWPVPSLVTQASSPSAGIVTY